MICSIFMALRAIYFQAILLRDPVQLIISDRVHWASQHPILILNSCSSSSLGAATTKLSRIDSLEACAIHCIVRDTIHNGDVCKKHIIS